MSYFLDSIGARQLTVVNDAFVANGTYLNGDSKTKVDDVAFSRAWRAEDTGAGVGADFLPQWGTTDWTMILALDSVSNFNPTGFATYRAWGLNDGSYANSPLYLRSNTSTTMRLVVEHSGTSLLNFTIPKTLMVVRIESSDTSAGVMDSWSNGVPYLAQTAHGATSASSNAGGVTMMQYGGKYTTNDYGMLGDVSVNKLAIVHSWITDQEIRDMAIALGVRQ